MITYYDGTAFNTTAKALVNTVNTVGVMGAGIAMEFALRFPDMLSDYQEKCKNKLLTTGKVDYYKTNTGIIIVNFPTKWHFKYPSKIEWIEAGLRDFVKTYKDHGITSIAFPRLGCANGGLNWLQVQPLMEKYLRDIDAHVYICLDKLPYAEGKEAEMVNKYNQTTINDLSKKIKLTQKQKENLEINGAVKRFWHISEIPGIGDKTYKAIFDLYYNNETTDDSAVQMTLF